MLKGLYIAGTNDYTIPADAMNILNSKMLDVCEIDGLGRPSADLYTTELVGADASVYSGQTVKSRQITLSAKPRNDSERMRLYRLLGYGQKKRLFFENDAGIYWIDGYVKSATYAAKPAQRTEIEIPIFCPYPWFRSLRAHEVSVPFGTSFSARQAGDIRAGIAAYAEMAAGGKLRTFELSDNVGNTVSYRSSSYYQHVGAKGYVRLVDTTPGAHGFMSAKAIQDITLANDWVTVPADEEGITITATYNTSETPNGKFVWYDTWGGI